MLQFAVDEARCTQCGECATECPAGIIALDGLPKVVDEDRCYRCQHCFAVCPTGAISIFGLDPDAGGPYPGELPSPGQLANLVAARRSIRRYKDENLPADLISRLADEACQAPTGVNAQSVLFTVVRDRAWMADASARVHARLAEAAASGGLPDGLAGRYLGWVVSERKASGRDAIFRGAPHLLITSAPKGTPCLTQDTHIALTTFELLAAANGVGTLWDGILMMALATCPDLLQLFGIPQDHELGYALLFGRPAVSFHRAARRGPARVNLLG